MVIQSIGKNEEEVFFWATHSGAEIDLFWQDDGKNFGVEIKNGSAPGKSRSLTSAINDLKLDKVWIVYHKDVRHMSRIRAVVDFLSACLSEVLIEPVNVKEH